MSTDPSEFLRWWDGMRERTLRAARLVPADRLEWQIRPGAMSVGDIVRHLAVLERWMFAENVCGRPARVAGYGPDLASGLDAVLAFERRLHAESMEIFAALQPADFERRCTTPAGAELRVWKWLRAMGEHEAHHRGQLYLILGALGVRVPPLYGLTAEEVAERSRGAVSRESDR